jgi:hypothetical protein
MAEMATVYNRRRMESLKRKRRERRAGARAENWLRGMDSNHDNQLQRLVSCRLDDPGIGCRSRSKTERADAGIHETLDANRRERTPNERVRRIADGRGTPLPTEVIRGRNFRGIERV